MCSNKHKNQILTSSSPSVSHTHQIWGFTSSFLVVSFPRNMVKIVNWHGPFSPIFRDLPIETANLTSPHHHANHVTTLTVPHYDHQGACPQYVWVAPHYCKYSSCDMLCQPLSPNPSTIGLQTLTTWQLIIKSYTHKKNMWYVISIQEPHNSLNKYDTHTS